MIDYKGFLCKRRKIFVKARKYFYVDDCGDIASSFSCVKTLIINQNYPIILAVVAPNFCLNKCDGVTFNSAVSVRL